MSCPVATCAGFCPNRTRTALVVQILSNCDGQKFNETLGRTGVEMEALTAVQVGLLTIHHMCKAVDRGMVMEGVRLLEK